MTRVALFPGLLGNAFERLDAPLRWVHRGESGTYLGTATVKRGSSWIARFACVLARLPGGADNEPVRVSLVADEAGETWTRWFGDSAPMRSRLRSRNALLVERLGPAVVHFHLSVNEGALLWKARRLYLLGMPLPVRLFNFRARVHGTDGQYHFSIDARLAGIGTLVCYEGVLHVEP